MNLRFSGMCLAVLSGIGALGASSTAEAGNVGYYGSCGGGGKVYAIAAAGHNPVAVASLSAASLTGLTGLVIESCDAYSLNADVNAAVNAGMVLVVNDWWPGTGTAAALPGAPDVVLVGAAGVDIDLAAGSPISTGPGGVLTNTILDTDSRSNVGHTASRMAPGMIALLTTANPAQTISFAYGYGRGKVVYNAIPLDNYLHNGRWDSIGSCTETNICAGMSTYLTNVVAWATSNVTPPGTTCASEGYTGTKLTWCQNICEKGYTGATLNSWIKRWTDKYRDLPYCAR